MKDEKDEEDSRSEHIKDSSEQAGTSDGEQAAADENETVHINITRLDEEGLEEFKDALTHSDHGCF